MINEDDYVDLRLTCNSVCAALYRRLKGKWLSELSGSVAEASSQLTLWVERKVVGLGASLTIPSNSSQDTGRYPKQGCNAERTESNLSSFPREKDSQKIAGWRVDLNGILLVLNVRSTIFVYGWH